MEQEGRVGATAGRAAGRTAVAQSSNICWGVLLRRGASDGTVTVLLRLRALPHRQCFLQRHWLLA